MLYLLQKTFDRIVRHGNLEVIDPSGERSRFGDGSGAAVRLRIKDRVTALKLIADPDLYFGEAYADGTISIEQGTLMDVLRLFSENLNRFQQDPGSAPWGLKYPYIMRKALRRLIQYNSLGRAKANVAHHYDLSGTLYDLFLDRDRQYSCAYFEHDDSSLDEAQMAKKRHLAAKLQLAPRRVGPGQSARRMKILDIGSGWGGMALYLAEVCGADVVGVTLSREQYKLSVARAERRGLSDHVEFRLMDYRDLDESFDRILSIGMFEHVGLGYYGEFFHKLQQLLKPDGIACLHSIARADGPGVTSAWINKYIFPGGYIPALSEVLPALEQAGLLLTDIEVLRLHYARTLQQWRRRFADHRAQVKALYDERFCRIWEFYLAGSECAFRYQNLNNFQIQLTRDQAVLPLTREYMISEEQRLREIDSRLPRLKSVS